MGTAPKSGLLRTKCPSCILHTVKWRESTRAAIRRECGRRESDFFTLQGLVTNELKRIIAETHTWTVTPEAPLRGVLDDLKKRGEIEFLDNLGNYRRTSRFGGGRSVRSILNELK